ncbi:MAG: hypothetical protein ACK5NF_07810 [Bacilli bacterium]
MKESKVTHVPLSQKKKIKKIEKDLDIHKRKNISALTNKSELISVEEYCNAKNLDIGSVNSILGYLQLGEQTGTLMYKDVLDWINLKVLNREFDKKEFERIIDTDKFPIEKINDRMGLKIIALHQERKRYLVIIHLSFVYNRSLYRYLVAQGKLIDYRLPENNPKLKRKHKVESGTNEEY